jgi:hypothetical protein
MLLLQDLEHSKTAATRIRATVQRHGSAAVVSALGDDGADLVVTYGALKTYILALDPTADVPDLS